MRYLISPLDLSQPYWSQNQCPKKLCAARILLLFDSHDLMQISNGKNWMDSICFENYSVWRDQRNEINI